MEGADPTTKWLKTSDGGYVWEGNLAGEGIITPSGMLGMAADMPHEQIAKHVKAIGNYEGSQPGCEVYPTLDGKVDVMVLEGKASAFSTGNSALQTREGTAPVRQKANCERPMAASFPVKKIPMMELTTSTGKGQIAGSNFRYRMGW